MLQRDGWRADRRVVVWMVASASAVQAFFQAVDAFLAASLPRAVLWLVAMVVMFLLAFSIERYKATSER